MISETFLPVKASPVRLAPDASSEEAFIAIISSCLRHAEANRPAVQQGQIEGVHQMRVAFRRLRSGLKLFRPLIWMLGVSTNALVRLLGFDPGAGKEGVSDAELRSMVVNAASLGAEERQIVDELFDAGDRSLREVMVPRIAPISPQLVLSFIAERVLGLPKSY